MKNELRELFEKAVEITNGSLLIVYGEKLENGDRDSALVIKADKIDLSYQICLLMEKDESFREFMLASVGSYLDINKEEKQKFIEKLLLHSLFGVDRMGDLLGLGDLDPEELKEVVKGVQGALEELEDFTQKMKSPRSDEEESKAEEKKEGE